MRRAAKFAQFGRNLLAYCCWKSSNVSGQLLTVAYAKANKFAEIAFSLTRRSLFHCLRGGN